MKYILALIILNALIGVLLAMTGKHTQAAIFLVNANAWAIAGYIADEIRGGKND